MGDDAQSEEIRGRRYLPYQRLALSLIGIIIMVIMWRWSVNHLYAMPQAALPAFASITTNCFYTIAILIIFFATGKMVWDWKNASTTAAEVATTIIQQTTQKQNPPQPQKDDKPKITAGDALKKNG